MKAIILGIACALFCVTNPAVGQRFWADHGRAYRPQVPGNGGWWDSASAIHRVTLKPNTRFWRFEYMEKGERGNNEPGLYPSDDETLAWVSCAAPGA